MLENRLKVNDPIMSVMDLMLVPVGTIIGPNQRERYRKRSMSQFVRVNEDGSEMYSGSSRTWSYASLDTYGYYRIVSYPDGYEPEESEEDLIGYRWRFRQHMLHAQQRHGVAISAVLTGLRSIGCDDDRLPLGSGVPVIAARDLNRMPTGTLVYTGIPEQPEHYAVWRRDHSEYAGWTRVVGPDSEQPPQPGVVPAFVIALPTEDGTSEAPPPWASESVTDDDLAMFKARAWMAGMKAKSSQGWCGTLEEVLRTVGVTAQCMNRRAVNGILVGATVNVSTANTLPVGTVFAYDDPNGYRVLYERVEDAPVRAGTRRVMAYRTDGSTEPVDGHANFATRMRVIAFPPEDGGVRDVTSAVDADLHLDTAWDALPLGSVVLYANVNYYIKAANGRMTNWSADALATGREMPLAGVYNRRDFSINDTHPMRVVRFGE
jgi:hypothetical protein